MHVFYHSLCFGFLHRLHFSRIQVESDVESQGSQDSMIIHDTPDDLEPSDSVDTEDYQDGDIIAGLVPQTDSTHSQPDLPQPDTGTYQADWVPPWRIKSGRVPDPNLNKHGPVHSEQEVVLGDSSVSSEPVPPWRDSDLGASVSTSSVKSEPLPPWKQEREIFPWQQDQIEADHLKPKAEAKSVITNVAKPKLFEPSPPSASN